MNECIFCKIVTQEIPAKLIFSNDEIIAFNDIRPKADVHILVIPKRHIVNLMEVSLADSQLLGNMLVIANQLAMEHGLQDGYRIQINNGNQGGQEVYHLHLHVVGNK